MNSTEGQLFDIRWCTPFIILIFPLMSCGAPENTKGIKEIDSASDSGQSIADYSPVYDSCTPPRAGDFPYPTYPEVPEDCLQNYWDGCELESGYAEENPTTMCSITEGFDTDGTMQVQFWEAYNYGRDYFGAYGPVFVYFLGPTNAASNEEIFRLRAQRKAIPDACHSVESQVNEFLTYNAPEELSAANNGSPGMFNISGNSPCNPVMDFMMINPMADELRMITIHEYSHVFQVAHSLTYDRDSDFGLNSWIMEGQATYAAAKFGDLNGWGPNFRDYMISVKEGSGNISETGLNALLESGVEYRLDNESYWETSEIDPGLIYYQMGAWAWAYLAHKVGGNYDIILKDFIIDIPTMGKEAAFQRHFEMTIDEFFVEFDQFIRGPDEQVWDILD
jgi:hypothetical protein